MPIAPAARFRCASQRTCAADRAIALPLLCAAFAVLALGCASSTGPTSTAGNSTGTLEVAITAPTGVSPSVTITGPNGYAETVSAAATLTGLTPGSYTITAATGLTSDSIVSIGYAGVVTGSPATVSANQTARATVTYSDPWSSSGVLWVANQLGNAVTGFTSSQLHATGAPTPAVSVGNGQGNSMVQGALALAVDQTGGMWISDGTDTLFYYTSAQIAQSTNAAAAAKLVSSTLQEPAALAFDPHGNLWVADQLAGKLFEFTAAQLATGGEASPAVTLSSTLGSIARPFSMAFDHHGDLWVLNIADSTIVGFNPSQLATTGAPLPYAALTGSPGIDYAGSIAFDAQGDLWVADFFSDTLEAFAPSALTSIGAPSPSVVLAPPSSALDEPQGIAFDNSGAMWLSDVQTSRVLRFLPQQLTTSGSPTPAVTISANGSRSIQYPAWIAFSPHARGVPIN